MSKFRSRNGGTPEVHTARSKLDGVLHSLVVKKEDEDTEAIEPENIEPTLPTPKRPSTSSSKQARKRKRGKEDVGPPEMGQYHHTYVMKLFDRSVDLAQFVEESPLYPVCRAWMRNQPHSRQTGLANTSTDPDQESFEEDEDDEGGIYRLPAPIPIKSEYGGSVCIQRRVPTPVPKDDVKLNIHSDPNLAPAPETLLLDHLDRWKATRQRWKVAGHQHESLFVESLDILKEMFDTQCKDQ